MHPKCNEMTDYQLPVRTITTGTRCEDCNAPIVADFDDDLGAIQYCPATECAPCVACGWEHATEECQTCEQPVCKEHLEHDADHRWDPEGPEPDLEGRSLGEELEQAAWIQRNLK